VGWHGTHKVVGHERTLHIRYLGICLVGFSMPGKACWWELYQNTLRPTLITNAAFNKSLISGWPLLEGLIEAFPHK